MSVDLETLSLPELKQLRKDVEKTINSFQKRKRKEALQAAEAAAAEAGFSLSELVGSGKASAKPARPAKYRHPENSSLTWSGRGRQPDWFKEAVGSGTNPEELLIS